MSNFNEYVNTLYDILNRTEPTYPSSDLSGANKEVKIKTWIGTCDSPADAQEKEATVDNDFYTC